MGLIEEIRAFADDRDWGQFHTPRNLALALSGEVGELASEFQWLTDEQALDAAAPGALRDRVSDEIADVGIYLLRMCDVLDLDFEDIVRHKLAKNAARYTVENSHGNANKQQEDHAMVIYLCPAGNPVAKQHYQDTVDTPVSISSFGAGSLRAKLDAAHPSGSAPMWGSTPGSNDLHRRKHDLMRTGDIALFYADKKFYSAAVIAVPFVDVAKASQLWGRDTSGNTWELMFSFSEVGQIDLAVETFNAAVGYAPNKYVQGFSRLDDEKSEAVVQLLGLAP